MITVKLSGNGINADTNLSQFFGSEANTFGKTRFVFGQDEKEADIWFVSDDVPLEDRVCSTRLVVFLSAETAWGPSHFLSSPEWGNYLHQFDQVFTNQALGWERAQFAVPFLPWMINSNHGPSILAPHKRDLVFFGDLTSLNKAYDLSVVCSTKTFTPGHKLRFEFVKYLEKNLGNRLHWFGNGVNGVSEKWDAIAPYRFHLALENQSSVGMVSEKLYDAYLGLSHPLYWGAPNVTDYFPPDSLTSINILDFKGSLNRIRETLDSDTDLYSANVRMLAKRLVLDDFNCFKRIGRIADELSREGLPQKHPRVLRPRKSTRSMRTLIRSLQHSRAW